MFYLFFYFVILISKLSNETARVMSSENERNSFFDMFKEQTQKSPFNSEMLLNCHQNNMKVMTEINKIALQMVQSFMQLQSDYMRQNFEEIQGVAQQMSQSPFLPNAIALDPGKVKTIMEKASRHTQDCGKVFVDTSCQIRDIMNDHVVESLEEFKKEKKK